MKSPIPNAGIVLSLARLKNSKLREMGLTPQHLRRLFHLIPLRERHALSLVHLRGARYRELAGILGISPRSVRRLLDRARARLRDPVNLAFIARWRRLEPAERRLVDLHRFKGMPLREIARMGLVALPAEDDPGPAPAASDRRGAALRLRDLKAFWRRIERRGQRWARRHQRADDDGDDGASGGPSSSAG
ncbi:MAG: sigma factor-like helix-turn-helix DNA-binding protein [Phycisphaerae bacterium]